MANPFYDPGAQRADKVRRLFATIAARYDLINDLQSLGLHRRWKRRLVALAAPVPNTPCLDLCCGTGDVGLALERRGARAVGLDFCLPMLEVARRRHGTQFSGCVRFVCGDVLRLPFLDASFEVVTISYGLRNLASVQNGLVEIGRVLRSGGRALVLDFGKPRNGAWRAAYFTYLGWCVPVLGWMVCGDAQAYGYILESLRHYPAQDGVAELMRGLGFADVRVINLLGGIMSLTVGKKILSRTGERHSPGA
ncbi:MAG: ubiquinone/menaquinone biosynthesis methyltransferase [Verrucomicrobia bacterium]|nr:ubiquinone/menaquinone biosynthesis methyltransferase [Verrucomicrobiota bacterium]